MSKLARDAGIRLAPDAAPETHSAIREWQAHLDAGRLTAAADTQTTPEIAANRARTEAIVLAHAAAHREALKTTGFWERE